MTNTGDRLLRLLTEPEVRDYWLQPGEAFELRADAESDADDFELVQKSQGLTVWPSQGMGTINVWANGVELNCGHQRPRGDA